MLSKQAIESFICSVFHQCIKLPWFHDLKPLALLQNIKQPVEEFYF